MDREANSENWLSGLLQEARSKGWCTRPACTTCGSTQFRQGLARHDRHARIEALGRLTENEVHDDLDAIHLVLMETAAFSGGGDLVQLFVGTPVGFVLDAMRAHAQARRDARLAREQWLAEAPARRETERRRRAETHGDRIGGKAARDAALREERVRLAGLEFGKRLRELGAPGYHWPIDAIGLETLAAGIGSGIRLNEADLTIAQMLVQRRRGPWKVWLKQVGLNQGGLP